MRPRSSHPHTAHPLRPGALALLAAVIVLGPRALQAQAGDTASLSVIEMHRLERGWGRIVPSSPPWGWGRSVGR